MVESCSQRGTPGRAVSECVERDGPDNVVSSRGAESGMGGHLVQCSVLWLFQNCCSGDRLSEALDCCCVESGWITETLLTMHTLRVDRS